MPDVRVSREDCLIMLRADLAMRDAVDFRIAGLLAEYDLNDPRDKRNHDRMADELDTRQRYTAALRMAVTALEEKA